MSVGMHLCMDTAIREYAALSLVSIFFWQNLVENKGLHNRNFISKKAKVQPALQQHCEGTQMVNIQVIVLVSSVVQGKHRFYVFQRSFVESRGKFCQHLTNNRQVGSVEFFF